MKQRYQFLRGILLTFLIHLAFGLTAQVPEKFSFQAVIRNSSGQLLASQNVGIRISLIQGSANGSVVFVETHQKTTNADGLVWLVIGSGSNVSGNMTTIEWANGPFFVKTEIDPAGGSSYTISDSDPKPLLGLPYAFHAKTAGSAGSRYVGELYGGGVVFWVDHTGQHGLIVSMVDINTSAPFSNVSSTLIGPSAQSNWNGAGNSEAITAQGGHTYSAAKLCLEYSNADYGTGVFSDWYLPSQGELNHLWNNFYQVQKALSEDGNPDANPISKASYWSSTEHNNLHAMPFVFSQGHGGYFGTGSQKTNHYYVRAVRAF